MRAFRSVVVERCPPELLWLAMRDHMAEVAAGVADIERVTQQQREVADPGMVLIVNDWRARHRIPPFLRALLNGDGVGWVDRNRWDDRTRICSWEIEPFSLGGAAKCAGRTTFVPAMAGRGARVTIEGSLDLQPSLLPDRLRALGGPAASFLEAIATTVIPNNLRDVVAAAAAFALSSDLR